MNKIMMLILALILSVPIFAQEGQSVFLNYKKREVKKLMMVHYPQCELIVEAKDYIEYRNNYATIGYRFDKLCYEMIVTVDDSDRDRYLKDRNKCDCWMELKEGGWVYKEIIDNKWVLIKEIREVDFSTFSFYLKCKEEQQ